MSPERIRACARLLLLACLARPAAADPAAITGPYRVLPDESELTVLVFRAGALARLGHNHVVSTRALSGRVNVGAAPEDSTLELVVPLDTLVVDDPEVRREMGSAFSGAVSEEDRSGTRRNMLGRRLLDADRHPEVRIRSRAIRGTFDDLVVTAGIDIRGEVHTVELPVSVVFSDRRLVATGRAELTHAALGLEPFTAALGTLRVADEMTFVYRVAAAAEGPEGEASRGERAFPVVEDDDAALLDRGTE